MPRIRQSRPPLATLAPTTIGLQRVEQQADRLLRGHRPSAIPLQTQAVWCGRTWWDNHGIWYRYPRLVCSDQTPLAASDATCAALSGGDTASRYLDANGGVFLSAINPASVTMKSRCRGMNGLTPAPFPLHSSVHPDIPRSFSRTVRFYDNQTSSCSPQTTGVCHGLLSARASTCTAGVGYWATDTTTLYRVRGREHFFSYYTAYAYPDPLQTTPGMMLNGVQLKGVSAN